MFPHTNHVEHYGNHNKGKNGRIRETKNNCPSQRPPEDNVVAAYIDMRIQVAEEGKEVEIKPNCERN